MPRKMRLIIFLVLIWAAIFAASYVLSVQIEGPRNIDTGFKRLEVLALFQFIAFAVAIVSAFIGFLWRNDGKRILLVGLIPLLTTVVLFAALAVTVSIVGNRVAPDPALPPMPTTEPVQN